VLILLTQAPSQSNHAGGRFKIDAAIARIAQERPAVDISGQARRDLSVVC
jgi:hypothetical protein